MKNPTRSSTGRIVASFMEAWIEIPVTDAVSKVKSRRLLHGGVD